MLPIAPKVTNTEKDITDAPKKTNTRTKRSCDLCRKRRTRCDGDTKQPCSRCKSAHVECQFLLAHKRRGPNLRKDYKYALESRLIQMEKLLEKIVEKNHSNRERKDNDKEQNMLQSQMQKLSISNYQRTRYLGDSMGVFILDREAIIDGEAQGISKEHLGSMQKVNNDKEEHVLVNTTEVMSPVAPLDNPMNRIAAFANVPYVTVEFMDHLIDIYFTRIHVYSPIINKVQFLEQYYFQYPSPPDKYLLFAIAYIGIYVFNANLSNTSGFDLTSKQLTEIEESLNKNAYALLSVACKRPTINTVQSLMLLSMYAGRGTNSEGDETSTWLITGIAIRIAQDLGLHRDCSQWALPDYEIELRKRLWFGLYMMDKRIAAELGRPLTIMEHDFDVELPSSFELGYSSSFLQSCSYPKPSLILKAEEAIRTKTPVYPIFVYMISLARISEKVLVGIHSTQAKKDIFARLDLVDSLDQNLTDWKSSLPPELQVDLDSSSHYFKAPAAIINIFYTCMLFLLYRPFIKQDKNPDNIHMAVKALRICTSAATNVLALAEGMERVCFVTLPWDLSLYSMFQAAIVFLHNAKSNDPSARQLGREYLVRCLNICVTDPYLSNAPATRILRTTVESFDVDMSDPINNDRNHITAAAGNSDSGQSCHTLRNSGSENINGNLLFNTSATFPPSELDISNTLFQQQEISDNTGLDISKYDPQLTGSASVLPYLTEAYDSSMPCSSNSNQALSDFVSYDQPAYSGQQYSGNTFLDIYNMQPITQAQPTQFDLTSLSSQVPLSDFPSGVEWEVWQHFLKTNVFDNENQNSI